MSIHIPGPDKEIRADHGVRYAVHVTLHDNLGNKSDEGFVGVNKWTTVLDTIDMAQLYQRQGDAESRCRREARRRFGSNFPTTKVVAIQIVHRWVA